MTISDNNLVVYQHKNNRWGIRRIIVAGAFGVVLSGSQLVLDFWPLGHSGSIENTLRGVFDLTMFLFLLPLAGFVVGLLIAAGIALWRWHFRQVASSILAIAAIPACAIVVAKVPLFDPWLWYAMANSAHFEVLAASSSSLGEQKYATVEVRDVSTGLAGFTPNHFIAIIYDESDAAGLEPSKRPIIWQTRNFWPGVGSVQISKGRRLYGHLFRRDDFE